MAQAKSVIPVATPASVTDTWREFSFGEGAFKMVVAVKPDCQDPDKGYYLQSHYCTSSADNADIAISYTNLPSDETLSPEKTEELYLSLLTDVADRAHGELMSTSDIIVNQVPGKSYHVKVKDGLIHYRSFIHRGYSASVGVRSRTHPRADLKVPDVDKLLAAFTPR